MPTKPVTPSREQQDALYGVIKTFAEQSKPLPSLEVLAIMASITSATASASFRLLEKRHLIICRRARQSVGRVVEIVETGEKTGEPIPKYVFWTCERNTELSEMWLRTPQVGIDEIASHFGATVEAVRKQAYKIGLQCNSLRCFVPEPPKSIGETHDPLLARLIQVYGRQPFKGATHKPGHAPKRIASAAGVVLREANC